MSYKGAESFSPRSRVVSGEHGKETVFQLNHTPDGTVDGRNDSQEFISTRMSDSKMTSSIWNPSGSGIKQSSSVKRESAKFLGVVMESSETQYDQNEEVVEFDNVRLPQAAMQLNGGM